MAFILISGTGISPYHLFTSPRHQYPCISTPASVPLHQYPCISTPASVPLHQPLPQYPCISTPASVPRHQYPCISTPASVPLHQYPCISTPASVHQYPCISTPASVPLHQYPCISTPASVPCCLALAFPSLTYLKTRLTTMHAWIVYPTTHNLRHDSLSSFASRLESFFKTLQRMYTCNSCICDCVYLSTRTVIHAL